MITAMAAISAGLPDCELSSVEMPDRPANELGRKLNAAIVHSTAEITAEM